MANGRKSKNKKDKEKKFAPPFNMFGLPKTSGKSSSKEVKGGIAGCGRKKK